MNGYSVAMAASVDIESRLADALRVLLPLAVTDCPEWAPEAEIARRNVAYMQAHLALLDYAESREDEAQPAPIEHLLSATPPLALAA